jgi:hypothetical protein
VLSKEKILDFSKKKTKQEIRSGVVMNNEIFRDYLILMVKLDGTPVRDLIKPSP